MESATRPLRLVGCMLMMSSVANGTTFSESVPLCTDPDNDPRWNVVGSGCGHVELPWMQDAVSATVVVSNATRGTAYRAEFSDRSETIDFDAPDADSEEAIYDLTVTFSFEGNKKATLAASCAAVRGLNGGAMRFVASSLQSSNWQMAGTSVVPTYAVDDAVAQDGMVLPEHGFWRGLGKIRDRETRLTLGDVERILVRIAGFVLTFR